MLRPLAALLLLVSAASAQEALQVRVSDAGAPVAGRLEVSPIRLSRPSASSGTTLGQLPGWPVQIGGNLTFAPTRGVVFCDLDGDGDQELVTSSTDGKLYAWHHDATAVAGFPVTLNSTAQTAPSVADIDRDGDLEIVQFTRGLTSGGRFYILDHQGAVLPGFPISVGNNNLGGSPTLADLDDDGQLEILVPERQYPIGLLHVFELDGSEWGGNWPVALDHVPTGSAGIADVDADGQVEIFYTSYVSMYLLETDGSLLPGWPKGLTDARFSYQSASFADLDGDQDLEIVVGAHWTNAGVYAFHHDGTSVSGWPFSVGTWTYCPPTIADLEGDGQLEILSGREGFGPGVTSSIFWAWSANGAVRSGFPYLQSHGGGAAGPIAVADLEGDGSAEIFLDHNILENGQGWLFGVDAQGNDLPGFPLRPNGFTYQNGPTVGDFDGDGDFDLAFLSFLDATVDVNVYDLGGSYAPRHVQWETYHQKRERGGRFGGGDAFHLLGTTAIGNTISLVLTGEAGETGFLWASLGTSSLRHPAFGWFHLSLTPVMFTIASSVTLPTNGEIAIPITIPSNPNLIGRDIRAQGLRVQNLAAPLGQFTNLIGVTIQ